MQCILVYKYVHGQHSDCQITDIKLFATQGIILEHQVNMLNNDILGIFYNNS